ncbi:MAG: diguanylate cyclase [Myxococcales bacterium]
MNEEQLLEVQYRMLVEQAPDGFVTTDADGRFLTGNPSFLMMAGYCIEELLKLRIHDLLEEDQRTQLSAHLASEAAGKTFAPTEWQLLRKDGSICLVEVSSKVLADGRRLAIVRDVTDRKRAEAYEMFRASYSHIDKQKKQLEELVEDRTRELRWSTASLSTAQAIAHLGSWEWDILTDSVTASEEAHRIMGVRKGRMSMLEFAAAVHPEDRDLVLDRMWAAVERLVPLDMEYRIQIPGLGKTCVVHSRATVERTRFGEARRMVGTLQDITVRKESELALERAKMERDHARAIARTDALTKLANRRTFDEMLHKEFDRLKRDGAALSLIMLDVDHFKKFNDTYGHVAGDNCLRHLAAALTGAVRRPADIAARYGGEEFAVILPETDTHGAAHVAERVRRGVEALGILHATSDVAGHVTVSLGVVTVFPSRLVAPDRIVALADLALYEAKHAGRNRIHVTSDGAAVADDCGDATIDGEHRKLVETSNTLLSAVAGGRPKDEILLMMESFAADMAVYFRYEEELFKAVAYPFADAHARDHQALVAKAATLLEKHRRDVLTFGELLDFLANDLVARHLLIQDKEFFPYVGTKGVALP